MEEEGNDDSYDSYGGGSSFNKPISRTQLPSAPRAARQAELIDMDKLPTKPPYTAFIGNLPYDISEEDIEQFFKNLPVKKVRLPNDQGRYKGFGYAEFEDKASLIEALSFNDELMRNRKVRVDLADQSQQGDDRGGGNKGGDSDRAEVSDWRRAPPEEASADRGREGDRDRGGYGFSRDGDRGSDRDRGQGRDDRGGFDRDDRSSSRSGRDYENPRFRDSHDDRDSRDNRRGYGGDRGYDRGGGGGYGDRDRDRGGYGDRDRGYGGDRDRGYGGDRDRGYGGDRDRGYGGDRDRGYGGDRDRGFGRSNDRYDDRDGGGRRQFGSGYRSGGRDDRYSQDRDDNYRRGDDDRGKPDSDRQDSNQDEAPKERPRLQLKPRTAPVEASNKPKPSSTGASASTGSSIFGSAKPVDTAQRERQIEERIRREREEEEEKENRERKRDRDFQYRDIRLTEGRGSNRSDKTDDSTEEKLAPPPTSRRDSDRERHPRRDSEKSNHSDVFEDEKKSPSKPTSPRSDEPPAKLIPAPPPKENIWDRRRTEQKVSPQSNSRPVDDSDRQTRNNDRNYDEERPRHNDDHHSNDRRIENDERRREPSNQKPKSESAPPSNAWSRGKPNIEAESRESAWSKREHEDSSQRGGRGGRGGPRGGRGGRGGSPRGGRGGGGDRGGRRDRDSHPKTIEDMPKYEEPKSKDFADSNKFSRLLEDQDVGADE